MHFPFSETDFVACLIEVATRTGFTVGDGPHGNATKFQAAEPEDCFLSIYFTCNPGSPWIGPF